MARGSEEMVSLAVSGAMLYALYRVAQAKGWLTSLSTTGKSGDGKAGAGKAPAGCDASFNPTRWVERKAYLDPIAGEVPFWNVVIGGKVVYTSNSQADAEAYYNRAVCGT